MIFTKGNVYMPPAINMYSRGVVCCYGVHGLALIPKPKLNKNCQHRQLKKGFGRGEGKFAKVSPVTERVGYKMPKIDTCGNNHPCGGE